MRKRQPSKEEKVAYKIIELLDSSTLNLDEVGKALARQLPNTNYNRLMIVAESAEWEKEKPNYEQDITLF